FLGADFPAMEEQQHWFTGKPEENYGLSLASDTEAYAGHLRKARELTQRSIDSAIRADRKDFAHRWATETGWPKNKSSPGLRSLPRCWNGNTSTRWK
ncbi:MAG: hypothetical protein DMG72_21190, partial [Acidobacteria bacterium]